MQRLQERRGEAARRSESGAGWNVRHAGNLQIAFLDSSQLESFPDDRMLDLIDRRCFLELRILEEKTIDEAAMNVDVNILVDRRRDEKTAMARRVGRKISAAAA